MQACTIDTSVCANSSLDKLDFRYTPSMVHWFAELGKVPG